MKKIFLLVALLLSLQSFAADLTREVLVATTATLMPRTVGHPYGEIINRGPNSLWCGIGSAAAAVANKSREVPTGQGWSFTVPSTIPIYCLTAVLQVTGAASVMSEGADK